jgi:hypothetical protein
MTEKHNKSQRVSMGKIMFEQEECPSCHHDKSKTWLGSSSPNFGKHQCTRCKHKW